jgi:hypothetical protein
MAANTCNKLDLYIKNDFCGPRSRSAEYENSIPMDYLKRSGADEINAIAEQLLSVLGSQFDFISRLDGKRLKTAERKMLFHIKTIVINLLVCSAIEDSHKKRFYISYSRNKNDYSKKYKRECPDLDYIYMICAVDALAKYGFIENKKGFFDRRNGCGRHSRMRAEERFINIVQNTKPDISDIYREHPLIFLRNENGDKIDASKNTRLHGMAKNIIKINEMLISAKIELHLDELQYSKLITRCHVDASFKTVYRSCLIMISIMAVDYTVTGSKIFLENIEPISPLMIILLLSWTIHQSIPVFCTGTVERHGLLATPMPFQE